MSGVRTGAFACGRDSLDVRICQLPAGSVLLALGLLSGAALVFSGGGRENAGQCRRIQPELRRAEGNRLQVARSGSAGRPSASPRARDGPAPLLPGRGWPSPIIGPAPDRVSDPTSPAFSLPRRHEVGARHKSSKKSGVGNPRIATDAGTVSTPSQNTAIGDHFTEQIGPGRRERDGRREEGLSGRGDAELG